MLGRVSRAQSKKTAAGAAEQVYWVLTEEHGQEVMLFSHLLARVSPWHMPSVPAAEAETAGSVPCSASGEQHGEQSKARHGPGISWSGQHERLILLVSTFRAIALLLFWNTIESENPRMGWARRDLKVHLKDHLWTGYFSLDQLPYEPLSNQNMTRPHSQSHAGKLYNLVFFVDATEMVILLDSY